jgi:hypothetical protein
VADSRRCSYADAVALRETQATPILLQVRSDVTRFRYGDEQHLDEALLRIFRINKACWRLARCVDSSLTPYLGWRHPAHPGACAGTAA